MIVITVTPLPEHCPVRDNATASGDAALDREADYEYETQDASDRCGGCGGTGMVDPPEPDGTCDDYEGP